MLGIDEHFFSKRKGYVTTFCDLKKHRVFELAMETLANTLENWSAEIACMWRFTKNNGITEGFHTKMEMIQRRAYGFKNFENYRLRVIVLCG